MSLRRALPLLAAVAVAVVVGVTLLIAANDGDSTSGSSTSAPAATAPAPPADEPEAAEGAAAKASPSGQPVPAGDLPGWRQVLRDDFTTDVASWGECGTFDDHTCPDLPDAYRSRWWAYPNSYQDTREKLSGDGGYYQPSNLSMSGGMLRILLRRDNGTTESAAPYPRMDPLTYGRYAVRWRVPEAVPGFKVAWLLWRTVTPWGEIDFPEGDLDGQVHAFMHKEDGSQDDFAGGVPVAGAWHTTVIEWTPGRVRFLLDGDLIGTSTEGVPDTPLAWILQSETTLTGDVPADGTSARIDVDWVSAWARE